MSSDKIERFCADMVENYGAIITPQQARDLLAVPDNKTEQVAERFRLEVQKLREEVPALLHGLEARLSGFLRPGTLARTLAELTLLLSAPLGGFRPSDVRTEVLASWLADSSSGCADGESAGELPTPSRIDDALPLNHAASVTVFDAAENEVQP